MTTRDKSILAGLYLSKFDSLGLKRLGFKSFAEAYNVIGYAVGAPPASIKNYRDEFDPLFPNRRKGWHKREIREHCLNAFEQHGDLDLDAFAGMLKSWTGYREGAGGGDEEDGSYFARLATGLAAERYFEVVQPRLPVFDRCGVENTTQSGCGYDFRLRCAGAEDFLAVEVKGLRERSGSLSLTPKEYGAAATLGGRFCLFVVKNFRESPFHEMFWDPLSGGLAFQKIERRVVQVSWSANV